VDSWKPQDIIKETNEKQLYMTIRIPEADLFDRILQLFGKRRAMKIPADIYQKFGPYVYSRAVKESFWRTLLRPKGQKPPEGYVYAEDLIESVNRLNIE
jgi:hypothetical protein